MARLIKTDGTSTFVKPNKGERFTLEELQALVGGLIEIVPHIPQAPRRPYDMLCNEEGLIHGLPFNHKASLLAFQHLHGDVLCLHRDEWTT